MLLICVLHENFCVKIKYASYFNLFSYKIARLTEIYDIVWIRKFFASIYKKWLQTRVPIKSYDYDSQC